MTETIEATIEGTVFRNEDNGYSVLEIRIGRKSSTAVGIMPPFASGEMVSLSGEWINHPQYGQQFKAVSCEVRMPTTLKGMERFLGSGIIRGMGMHTAGLAVKRFGLDTLEILDKYPERLTEIKGIGKIKAQMIARSYQDSIGLRNAMVFLQSYDISPQLALKISRKYGEKTEHTIKENPYRMVRDIEGIGFLTADRIALSVGIAADSPFRYEAALLFVLQEASVQEGHTYLPLRKLIDQTCRLLQAEEDGVLKALQKLLLSRDIIRITSSEEEGGCMLCGYYYLEKEIAERLIRLLNAKDTVLPKRAYLDAEISSFEKRNRIQLSECQRTAVIKTMENAVMIITGGPGTGKTTIIHCILSLLGKKVFLAAPTGRAAKRMQEAAGLQAKTLHRLLEYAGDNGEFQRNESNPLDCDCLIIDEMSMVDVFLMASVLRAVKPGTKLVLVGDADQLPSVGPGNVLGDLLNSGMIPNQCLKEIFRQGMDSQIVLNAHRINDGDMPVLNRKDGDFFLNRTDSPRKTASDIVALCTQRLPAFLKTHSPVSDIQVLAPAKKGLCGVINLNQMLQAAFKPPAPQKREIKFGDTVFRTGDKVIHTKNDYSLCWISDADGKEGTGVFNGDMGRIEKIDSVEKTISVRFDDGRLAEYDAPLFEELDLAYCLSVHKSQGSEYPCVVMPAEDGPQMLLTRNLLYTAVTRAKKLLVLCGNESAILRMIRNDHVNHRYTTLSQRVSEASFVRGDAPL